VSGTDSLIIGGALILLVLGELVFGELLQGGAVSWVGVMAGEVLLFAWLGRPSATRHASLSASTSAILVAAFVTAIAIFEIGDFIEVLRNFSLLTGQGIASLLDRLSHWLGAAMMVLGVVAAWGPAPAAPSAPRPAV
jgi:hypothetical protein